MPPANRIRTLVFLAMGLHLASAFATTVSETLAAEAKASVEKSTPEVKARVVIPADLLVSGVYGVSTNLRTDVVYNGEKMRKLASGDRVGPLCVIKEIAGSCVTLQPSRVLPEKNRRNQRKTDSTALGGLSQKELEAQCPRSCWTMPRAPQASMDARLPTGLPPSVVPPALLPANLTRTIPSMDQQKPPTIGKQN